jgi:transcriptional regulator with XRE-family HTH domain
VAGLKDSLHLVAILSPESSFVSKGHMKKVSPKEGKVGLREIADIAGVSIATVSRVLNGNSRVDPSIQKTVLAAAAKLNVDLSQRNKTKTLAFLLSNRAMLHAFHSRILIGAEAHCASCEWSSLHLERWA